MGMFSFIKEAGEKLFGIGQAQAATPADPSAEELNQSAAQAIATCNESMKLNVEGLDVALDGASETVTVATPEPESQWYPAVRGDNLSKISKAFSGAPNQYPQIFEAKKPMLSHSDKIYPGQVPRIPGGCAAKDTSAATHEKSVPLRCRLPRSLLAA